MFGPTGRAGQRGPDSFQCRRVGGASSHAREESMNKLVATLFTSLLMLGAMVPAVRAADAPRGGASGDLATYQGDDRQERLIAAAKREGELSVYHVYPNLPIVMDAFTKK